MDMVSSAAPAATASPGPALPVPAPGPSPALTLLPAGPKAQPGKTEPAQRIHGRFCIKWVLDKRGLREELVTMLLVQRD